MSPGKRDLVRYREVRRADTLDDQKSAPAIQAANTALTQEGLQEFVLSQLKRVIWGARAGHWNDDFLGAGTRDLTGLSRETEFLAACLATDAVGHFVHVTGPVVGGLRQVTRTNILDSTRVPAVGVITEKTSTTTCRVRTFGEYAPGFTVEPGKNYWIGYDGEATRPMPTGTPADPIIRQIVAYGLDETTLLVCPQLILFVNDG